MYKQSGVPGKTRSHSMEALSPTSQIYGPPMHQQVGPFKHRPQEGELTISSISLHYLLQEHLFQILFRPQFAITVKLETRGKVRLVPWNYWRDLNFIGLNEVWGIHIVIPSTGWTGETLL